MGCSVQESAVLAQLCSRAFGGAAVVSYLSSYTAELHEDEELSPMLQERSCSLSSVPELTIMLK